MIEISKQKSWNELRIKLMKKYPQLTDKDMQYKAGKEEGMLRMVEYKLRKTKQEMQEIIIKIGFFTYEN